MSYEIKLPLFEGPFDLLLFFIERDELDIKDIPITKITDEFLDYLKHLEKLNLEVASEFILVAATLMQIKAKMLLPRPELDLAGNEIDPREELVRHLLEYKKYKSLVSTFGALEEQRQLMNERGNILDELRSIGERNNVEAELQDVDLYKLLKVYMKVMERFEAEKSKPIHTVTPYPYTIESQKEYIINLLTQRKKLPFTEIVSSMPEKIAIIYNFLSILELLQLKQISINLGEGYNNFWIEQL
ncbi:MAG: segregation/condensation protein A [Bacteroidota bacterium]|nr:segregation/condensation protein A [Bacteroidota bacterium]